MIFRAWGIDIASDAHFWKTHDIDTLAHASLKVGVDRRQIIINSTSFTAHLDEANRDCLHMQPYHSYPLFLKSQTFLIATS